MRSMTKFMGDEDYELRTHDDDGGEDPTRDFHAYDAEDSEIAFIEATGLSGWQMRDEEIAIARAVRDLRSWGFLVSEQRCIYTVSHPITRWSSGTLDKYEMYSFYEDLEEFTRP
jgi:hypothetical protein